MGSTVSISTVPRTSKSHATHRKAYLIAHVAGTSAQFNFICSIIGLPPRRVRKGSAGKTVWSNLYRGTVQLLASTMFRLSFSYTNVSFSRFSPSAGNFEIRFRRFLPSIPIPSDIWSLIGGAWTWGRLVKLGVIEEVVEADPKRHRCREFRLCEDLVEGFVRVGFLEPGRVINLVTRRALSRIRRSPATDPSRHPWFSSLSGEAAFKALSAARCYINLRRMEEEVLALRRQADIDKSLPSRHRALCAEAALLSIRLEGDLRFERWLGAGMYSYQPAYRPSYPGRLHELGLGVQGCPRSVKAAAFDYPGVINYDLTSALAAALLAVVDQYNTAIDLAIERYPRKGRSWAELKVNTTWLSSYITRPDRGSRWLAERLGVPRDEAKRILYALMFGGTRSGAVRDVLMQYHELDEEKVKVSLRRVGRLLCWKQREGSPGLAQMLDQLDEVIRLHVLRKGPFAQKTVRDLPLPIQVNGSRHGRHIVNAVGRRLKVLDQQGLRAVRDDLEPVGDRHVRCHVLQGVEQQFICEVVYRLLRTEQGQAGHIRIMSQQHDGFVVLTCLDREEADAIVQICVREAQEATVLGEHAHLEIKPIG